MIRISAGPHAYVLSELDVLEDGTNEGDPEHNYEDDEDDLAWI